MGVVTINGQRYDSVTGLMVDDPGPLAEAIETPKPRRQSKQERLAEAIAREFNDNELGVEITTEPVRREVPDWISQFTERQVDEVAEAVEQPAWVTNYISGGDPIEIQPIGLEAAAREAAQQQTVATNEPVRSEPQHNHRSQQSSSTLHRDFVQKPDYATQISVKQRTPASVETHPDVHRFAPVDIEINEATVTSESKSDASFAPVMTHSMEEKFAEHQLAKSAPTSSDLKSALINEQMSQPIDDKSRAKAEKKAAHVRRRFAAPTLITAALAILVLGGYFTYVSMPSISVRVAAARAGVDARAPYTPSGYSIDGPVAYEPGRVTINYKSNGGGAGYSFTQQNNSWGDNVVLDDIVEGDNYTTLKVGNLEIYRYGNNTAWLHNGILFTLNGNESLGDDQIARIVESI
ncbi:MAG: DUF4367 domain-containing protein [Candidatus Nomurabacteria bacterium]|jgi:hypothetical protein|nr:DUF4367 domain-containing protein [Candidatus Nomurabacteria bacterium]